MDLKGYAIHDTKKYTDFKVIDFKSKSQGPYDIDIATTYCGVCSSDVHTITGGWGEPILPLVSGHEIAGKVVAVGEKVTEFKVGDRAVVGAQVCSCFECKACENDLENYCMGSGDKGPVDTYNAKYENGDIAHGGYSNGVRVHERFVFAVPEGLKDEDVAPMACGGLTVFAPLEFYGTGPGKKVGIVGIGGLGHFAVQFAAALGAEVTAFTHQGDKIEDAKKMGAKHVVNTSEKEFEKNHAFEFDLLLSTVDDSKAISLPQLTSMLNVHGRLHMVGLPDKELEAFKAQALAGNGASISVSHIGSKVQANKMYKLAAEKGVTTWKEIIPMKDVGKAIEGVKTNKARYRYVLKMDL